jgi:hypothetical protein
MDPDGRRAHYRAVETDHDAAARCGDHGEADRVGIRNDLIMQFTQPSDRGGVVLRRRVLDKHQLAGGDALQRR